MTWILTKHSGGISLLMYVVNCTLYDKRLLLPILALLIHGGIKFYL